MTYKLYSTTERDALYFQARGDGYVETWGPKIEGGVVTVEQARKDWATLRARGWKQAEGIY